MRRRVGGVALGASIVSPGNVHAARKERHQRVASRGFEGVGGDEFGAARKGARDVGHDADILEQRAAVIEYERWHASIRINLKILFGTLLAFAQIDFHQLEEAGAPFESSIV